MCWGIPSSTRSSGRALRKAFASSADNSGLRNDRGGMGNALEEEKERYDW